MHFDVSRIGLSVIRGACLAMALALAGALPAFAAMRTTTTTYEYNADGALTAVTTQIDALPAATTYLTWDNFTPDAAAPTTGTVSAADGNLAGIGPVPGGAALATQFTYDVRDRLTACSPAGRSAASYAYDPTSMLASSTLASGDALQFYYDDAATARMINTSQPSTGVTASFLGPVRYLSDGSEQVLLNPRKDVAGVYDATAETLAPYAYEPYGAPLECSASTPLPSDDDVYDLTQNPFQYAGEYADPTCDAYFLRARWLLTRYQTFLSRDPADPMHRYSYTAGNPIGRTDPSGLRSGSEVFSRDISKAVHTLAPGIAGYIEPILPVWGQVMGGIEMLGLLPSFWHRPTAEGVTSLSFLAASVVTDAGAEFTKFDRLFSSYRGAFYARLGIDAVLGASQTAAQADRHGRLDVPALIQGVDTTAFGMFYARAFVGFGYRPYNMTADDVYLHATDVLPVHNDLLIFRSRVATLQIFKWDVDFSNTSPLFEDLHLGLYHEGLIAFGRDAILHTDLVTEGPYAWISADELTSLSAKREYMYVGSVPATERNIQAMQSSPLGVPISARSGSIVSTDENGVELDRQQYRMFSKNCQHHSLAVRRQLGL